jgi:wyosine [tRNA(Phe)-imidazoG37] synthetase (radical SAM superfamily)
VACVYGPVPSRRLGQSLGIDPIPLKTCNYNCVYCQLGRTRPVTNRRKDFFPPEEILSEVRQALKTRGSEEIDYLTFVGQGEPTLCASLGWLIRRVKEISPIPVAVITNGALLHREDVREELLAADMVMPTLDAADDAAFRKVNRPWPRFRIAGIIEGMRAFRKAFQGRLWIEVMLVKGVNDGEQALLAIRDALRAIGPDQVQINVPIRPPAEAWVEIPDQEALMRAVAILGEAAEVIEPYEGSFDLSGSDTIVEAVLTIIRRHPMREVRLIETLSRYAPEDVRSTLAELERSGQARRRTYRGQAFWGHADVVAGGISGTELEGESGSGV